MQKLIGSEIWKKLKQGLKPTISKENTESQSRIGINFSKAKVIGVKSAADRSV
jgi:hypothetical protein